MKVQEVFVLNGRPTTTLIRGKDFNRIKIALDTPGQGVVVEGPSGIGKTVAVTTAIEESGLSNSATMLSGRKEEDHARIEGLLSAQDTGTLVIDDFHRLPAELQSRVADDMKIIADQGLESKKWVLIGITKVGATLVEGMADLGTRIRRFQFEQEPREKIEALIDAGEKAMNVVFSNRRDIVDESNGSFFLAQMICLEICLSASVLDSQREERIIEVSFEQTRSRIFAELDDKFRKKAITFASGTKLRSGGRAPYLHCLKWLAEADTWSITLDRELARRPDFKGSVGQIVNNQYLEQLFKSKVELADILHYHAPSTVFSAEDPQFVFWLRNLAWRRFAREVGFVNALFDPRYDVALSFAGADRDVAEAMRDHLTEQELSVFYDRDEQHRMAAEDLEDYLAPIYTSEAALVVPIMGPDYPNRVWTRFESKHFKERYKDGAVVPVWVDPARPAADSAHANVGYFSINKDTGAFQDQVRVVGDAILRKMRDVKAESEALRGDES